MTAPTDAPAADAVAYLRALRESARGLGGPERVARQHARGLLTARERIDLLLDPGSELPLGSFLTSGVPGEEARTLGNGLLTGFGEIDGRPVGYYASDATVKGGSLGGGNMRKKTRIHRVCEQAGLPLFALIQGGGGRITDVLSSRFAGVPGGELGERLAFPNRWNHFAAVMGNYYAPWDAADADFCIMTQNSNLSIASPPVVQEASGEFVSPFDIGGAEIQGRVTGQVDAVTSDDAAAIALLRRTFSYVPGNAWEPPPVVRCGDPVDRREPALRDIIPDRLNRAYDVRKIIRLVVDRDSFMEWTPDYASNLVAGLARLDGHAVAIIANQPSRKAGSLDVPAVNKIDRMLRACDAFRLPLLSFVDVPGVIPNVEQEHHRLLTVLYDMAIRRIRVPVPKIAISLRKGYGYAYPGMSASDYEWHTIAWPTSQIMFMGPEPGVRVAFRREMEAAPDPQAYLEERAETFRERGEPWIGARLGYLDDVIDPADTRPVLARILEICRRRMRPYR